MSDLPFYLIFDTLVLVCLLGFGLFTFARTWRFRREEQDRRKNTATCPSTTGRVVRVLDGALLAAAASATLPLRRPNPFVARFLVMTPEGLVGVEPGETRLVDIEEINIGDRIRIQGPSEPANSDAYRGNEPIRVFRGTLDCPLELSRPESRSEGGPASSRTY